MEEAGAWPDLLAAIAAADVETIDWPHVVVYSDQATGCINAAGPFTSAVEACSFAIRLRVELDLDAAGAVVVSPLHPADR